MDFTRLTYEFDKPIMGLLQGSDSLFFDRVIYTLTLPWTWIPLYVMLIVLIIKNNETTKQIALLLFFAILSVVCADVLIDNVAKPLFMRWRPARDPFIKYTVDVVNEYRGGKFGFFSAHAANTMSVAVFFALVVKSRIFSLVVILWSLLNGYTRIYLGVHYPSDVLTGWIWGMVIAFVCYYGFDYINRRITTKRNYISSQFTKTGYSYTDIYAVIILLIITVLLSGFRGIFPI